MAKRPVFRSHDLGSCLVESELIEFKFHNGMAIEQKRKSIAELHHAISQKYPSEKILEVSTKSLNPLGVKLSAFNLKIQDKKRDLIYSVESAYQSSKVFEKGGPYIDILKKSSLEAKKDERILNSGALIGFEFFNTKWDVVPQTAFYDWLYINVLNLEKCLHDELIKYQCFTDIEFNPLKSVNCQAHSVALFSSLYKRNLLDSIKSPEFFLKLYHEYRIFDLPNSGKIQLQGNLL